MYLFLCWLLLQWSFLRIPAELVPGQLQALKHLFNECLKTVPTGRSSIDWTEDKPYCEWKGISCCSTYHSPTNHQCINGLSSVEVIELPNAGMSCVLPDIFTAFPDLLVLDLSHNKGITGGIPPSLGALRRLWVLRLYNTSMSCQQSLDPVSSCPLPPYLEFESRWYVEEPPEEEHHSLVCRGIQFKTPREQPAVFVRQHHGICEGTVVLSPSYYESEGCSSEAHHGDVNNRKKVLLMACLIPVLGVLGLCLLGMYMAKIWRTRSRRLVGKAYTAWKKRYPPGLVDGNISTGVLEEITVAITDVEGSTELWEWDYNIMTLAQEIHDTIMRGLISKYVGYEVNTEGDSFTVAFHDALDAVAWALHVQEAMLEADWPEELLDQEKAGLVYSQKKDSSIPDQLLFRGLRVRIAINTGIPAAVQRHHVTDTLEYHGQVMDLAAAIGELPAGGQILLGPQTFHSVAPRLKELGELISANLTQMQGKRRMRSPKYDVKAASEMREGNAENPSPGTGSLGSRHVDLLSRWSQLCLACCGVKASEIQCVDDGMLGEEVFEGVLMAEKADFSTIKAVTFDPAGSEVTSTSGFFHRSLGSLSARNSLDLINNPKKSVVMVDSADPMRDVLEGRAGTEYFLQESWSVPLLIDKGSHLLEGIIPNASGNSSLPGCLLGTRLTEVVMRPLAARIMHFPPLPTVRQMAPGYLEAPAALESLLPGGMVFKREVCPNVAIVFCAPYAFKSIEAVDVTASKEALYSFTSCIRSTLHACRGYECQEKDGIFMMAFEDIAMALEWSCVLQLALLRVQWNKEILKIPAGREIVGEDGVMLFRGLRARVGIYQGEVSRVIPHRSTGRADYFGPLVNRAARFMSAAGPGQILAEAASVDKTVTNWKMKERVMLEVLGSAPPSNLPPISPARIRRYSKLSRVSVESKRSDLEVRDFYGDYRKSQSCQGAVSDRLLPTRENPSCPGNSLDDPSRLRVPCSEPGSHKAGGGNCHCEGSSFSQSQQGSKIPLLSCSLRSIKSSSHGGAFPTCNLQDESVNADLDGMIMTTVSAPGKLQSSSTVQQLAQVSVDHQTSRAPVLCSAREEDSHSGQASQKDCILGKVLPSEIDAPFQHVCQAVAEGMRLPPSLDLEEVAGRGPMDAGHENIESPRRRLRHGQTLEPIMTGDEDDPTLTATCEASLSLFHKNEGENSDVRVSASATSSGTVTAQGRTTCMMNGSMEQSGASEVQAGASTSSSLEYVRITLTEGGPPVCDVKKVVERRVSIHLSRDRDSSRTDSDDVIELPAPTRPCSFERGQKWRVDVSEAARGASAVVQGEPEPCTPSVPHPLSPGHLQSPQSQARSYFDGAPLLGPHQSTCPDYPYPNMRKQESQGALCRDDLCTTDPPSSSEGENTRHGTRLHSSSHTGRGSAATIAGHLSRGSSIRSYRSSGGTQEHVSWEGGYEMEGLDPGYQSCQGSLVLERADVACRVHSRRPHGSCGPSSAGDSGQGIVPHLLTVEMLQKMTGMVPNRMSRKSGGSSIEMRRRFDRVPVQVQVHDMGTYMLKGLSSSQQIVQIVPTCLAERIATGSKASAKKTICLKPASGLRHEVYVDMVNISEIMYNPMEFSSTGGLE